MAFVKLRMGQNLFSRTFVKLRMGQNLFSIAFVKLRMGQNLFRIAFVKLRIGQNLFRIGFVKFLAYFFIFGKWIKKTAHCLQVNSAPFGIKFRVWVIYMAINGLILGYCSLVFIVIVCLVWQQLTKNSHSNILFCAASAVISPLNNLLFNLKTINRHLLFRQAWWRIEI